MPAKWRHHYGAGWWPDRSQHHWICNSRLNKAEDQGQKQNPRACHWSGSTPNLSQSLSLIFHEQIWVFHKEEIDPDSFCCFFGWSDELPTSRSFSFIDGVLTGRGPCKPILVQGALPLWLPNAASPSSIYMLAISAHMIRCPPCDYNYARICMSSCTPCHYRTKSSHMYTPRTGHQCFHFKREKGIFILKKYISIHTSNTMVCALLLIS